MELDVHLEGVDGPIGQLSRNADSGVAFQYALAELPYPLSLALPVQEAPFRDVATRGYFENLLFENRHEAVMERRGGSRPSSWQ